MAKITIKGGLVFGTDLGLDLFGHSKAPAYYDAKGLHCVAVWNAEREDTCVQYAATAVDGTEFNPLQQYVPMECSVRSLLVAPTNLPAKGNFEDWTEDRLYAPMRKRDDGSEYPVLRPAIRLPDDSVFAVTHFLHVVSMNFREFRSCCVPKATAAHGDEIHLELPGNFAIYSGKQSGPMVKLDIQGHDEFDQLIVAPTQRPDEPSTGYPPK